MTDQIDVTPEVLEACAAYVRTHASDETKRGRLALELEIESAYLRRRQRDELEVAAFAKHLWETERSLRDDPKKYRSWETATEAARALQIKVAQSGIQFLRDSGTVEPQETEPEPVGLLDALQATSIRLSHNDVQNQSKELPTMTEPSQTELKLSKILEDTIINCEGEDGSEKYLGPRLWPTGTMYVFDGKIRTLVSTRLPLVPGAILRIPELPVKGGSEDLLLLEHNFNRVLLAPISKPSEPNEEGDWLRDLTVDLEYALWVRLDSLPPIGYWSYALLQAGKHFVDELTEDFGEDAVQALCARQNS